MTDSSSKKLNHLDVDFVRSCFPTFQEPLAAKTAFFENAGGSYVAGAVLDQLMHFYKYNKVQPYGAAEILNTAGVQMDSGRQTMADLLGINTADLTLGASTTQNFNTLAYACEGFVTANSEVIVTDQDHEANIGAWERLCERTGATLKVWPVNAETAELDIADFENLLTPATAIVCMTHSSNIVGTVNPVESVISLCRKNGTRVAVDGVSYAPHMWPDIPSLQPDAYCFSTYKTYGTHMGAMYTSADFRAHLTPQCHYFNRGYANKLLDGTGPDHASIAALSGLGEYFNDVHQHHFGDNSQASLFEKARQISSLMHAHETQLCNQLLNGISQLPLRIVGRDHTEGREANIALTSTKKSSAVMSQHLATKDIAAGNGNFYATRLLGKVGISDIEDGVLRVSFSHYNTAEEVDRVIEALKTCH